jgi:signal transduction histidine kinase
MPDDIRRVEADEGQLIQVFQNLVINADQAMPEGGVVKIRAENVRIN